MCALPEVGYHYHCILPPAPKHTQTPPPPPTHLWVPGTWRRQWAFEGLRAQPCSSGWHRTQKSLRRSALWHACGAMVSMKWHCTRKLLRVCVCVCVCVCVSAPFCPMTRLQCTGLNELASNTEITVCVSASFCPMTRLQCTGFMQMANGKGIRHNKQCYVWPDNTHACSIVHMYTHTRNQNTTTQ